MKFRRIGIAMESRVRLDRDEGHDLAEPTEQTSPAAAGNKASATLPEELIEEILLRIPLDEPAFLVRTTLVCKAWHRILSDDAFRHRHHRFHGTPPLLGYMFSRYRDSTVRFVPTTTLAAAASFKPDDSSGGRKPTPTALDCRHGRVLIETETKTDDDDGDSSRRFIVWDAVAGSHRHLGPVPTNPEYPFRHNYAGAVLCAKHHDSCDNLHCHGGPFLVVLVGMSYDNDDEQDGQTWASVYSSETGAWSSLTTPNEETNLFLDYTKTGLLIGDALYFIAGGYNIVRYDFRNHELSAIHLPEPYPSIVIKADGGGLGVAATLCRRICVWSWQVSDEGVGEWIMDRFMDLDDTLLPKGYGLPDLICMAEGTSTVFIGLERKGVYTLDLNSGEVRKIGKAKNYYRRPVLPYMSFYAPKN